MTELKRWTEEGAPEAIGRLLRAAESEEPSAASLASTLASLGVASAATSVTTSAAGSGAAGSGAAGSGAATSGTAALAGAAVQGKLSMLALTASLAKWMALGSVVGGATVVAVDAMTEAEEARPVSSVRPIAAPHPPPNATATAIDQTAAAPSTSAGVERTVASKASTAALPRAAPAPVARAAPAPIAAETLAEEIAGIDRARSLLAAGRYAATTAALDDYERRFPKHHFGPEVLYLRMEAALGAGRAGEARRLAQRLLASYPQSPQSERAKQLLVQKKQ